MKIIVGQGSCGIATGAKKTSDEFERICKEKGIDIKIDKAGCVGNCYLEPIVDVYSDDDELTRYVQVQPERVEQIIEEHILGGVPVEEFKLPEDEDVFLKSQTRIVLRNCGVINPEEISDSYASKEVKSNSSFSLNLTPNLLLSISLSLMFSCM